MTQPSMGIRISEPLGDERLVLLRLYEQCNGINWSLKEGWQHAFNTVASGNIDMIDRQPVPRLHPNRKEELKPKPSNNNNITDSTCRSNPFSSTSATANQNPFGAAPTKDPNPFLPSVATKVNGKETANPFGRTGEPRSNSPTSFKSSASLPSTSAPAYDRKGRKWSGIVLSKSGLVSELQLVSNLISGVLPEDIGALQRLRLLHLHDNRITGSLPRSLGMLNYLQWLNLSGNNFSGHIPSSFGNLTSLVQLNLCNNLLDGPIPKELASLSFLQSLLLTNNKLSGSLPIELSRLRSLEFFSVSHNELTGPLPIEYAQLVSLRELRLDNNKFNGNIPPVYCELKSLQALRIENNDISGSVPKGLRKVMGLGPEAVEQSCKCTIV